MVVVVGGGVVAGSWAVALLGLGSRLWLLVWLKVVGVDGMGWMSLAGVSLKSVGPRCRKVKLCLEYGKDVEMMLRLKVLRLCLLTQCVTTVGGASGRCRIDYPTAPASVLSILAMVDRAFPEKMIVPLRT